MMLNSDYHSLPLHLRGVLVVKNHLSPLISWYFATLFFEVWADGVYAWTIGSYGPAPVQRFLLELSGWLAMALKILSSVGLTGAMVLAVGLTRGESTRLNFTPGLWLKDLFLENVRVLFISFLWAMAFIVPGVVRLVRYSFVPVIVMLEPEYRANRVDALKTSAAASEGIFLKLFGLFSLGITAIFLEELYAPTDANVLAFALARILVFFLYIMISVLLCDWYFDQRKKKETSP